MLPWDTVIRRSTAERTQAWSSYLLIRAVEVSHRREPSVVDGIGEDRPGLLLVELLERYSAITLQSALPRRQAVRDGFLDISKGCLVIYPKRLLAFSTGTALVV